MKARCSHWVVRQVGYEALLLSDRRHLHATTARALEDEDAITDRSIDDAIGSAAGDSRVEMAAERIEAHWAAAGVPARAALYAVHAARGANHAGRFRESLRHAERALSSLDAEAHAATVRARMIRARALQRLGRTEEAEGQYRAAEELADSADGDAMRHLALQAVSGRASVLSHSTRFDEAAGALDAAIEKAEAAGLATEAATLLADRGAVDYRRGDLVAAEKRYRAALSAWEGTGNLRQEATLATNIGGVLLGMARHDEAQSYTERALALQRASGDRYGQAWSLNNLANIFGAQGRLGEARRLFDEALAIGRTGDDRRVQLAALNGLAAISTDAGRFAEAVELLATSCQIAREVGDRWSESWSLSHMAEALVSAGDHAAARPRVNEAIRVSRARGQSDVLCQALTSHSRLLLAEGDAAAAIEAATEALGLAREGGNVEGEVYASAALAAAEADPIRARAAADLALSRGLIGHACAALLAASFAHRLRGDQSSSCAAAAEAAALAAPRGLDHLAARAEALRR